MAGTLPLGQAVWLSARNLCGPPGLWGAGWGRAGSQAGRGLAVRLSEQLSLELAGGFRAFLSGGGGAGVLPHREEAAGTPGASSRCPTETSAGSEGWRMAHTQERSSVSAALNLCPERGPDPLADRLGVTGRQVEAVDSPEIEPTGPRAIPQTHPHDPQSWALRAGVFALRVSLW